MTGSGNDFVMVTADVAARHGLERPEAIRAICARGTGVGADGLVVLEMGDDSRVAIRYYNSDGSRASLCGNATLCSASLARGILGLGEQADLPIGTDSGDLISSWRGSRPAFRLPQPAGVVDSAAALQIPLGADETRIGFAIVGVPHLVVEVSDLEAVPIEKRGAELRSWPSILPAGANVNFIQRESPNARRWRMRTFERGVEGETLACGTGAGAVGVLLDRWEGDRAEWTLVTRSGSELIVRKTEQASDSSGWWLGGEGRLVYEGTLDPGFLAQI